MNTTRFLIPLTTLLAWPLIALQARAQDPASAPVPHKLQRLSGAEAQNGAAPLRLAQASEPFDAQAWRKRLGDGDLAAREKSFDELLDLAREQRDARAALEDWSRASDAPELAWTARLALRELERAPRSPARWRDGAGAVGPRSGQGREWNDLRSRFDELERHFGGMDSMFEDLRAQMDQMMRNGSPGARGGWLQPAPRTPQGGGSSSQSFQLQVGPDGVTLESTENVDGQEQKKTYKAKDMDELLQNYPELREKLGDNLRFDLRGAPGRNWLFLDDGLPDDSWIRSPRPTVAPPTDVLGIYSQKLSPEEAKALGLEPEQGLRVERIEPGTIAQILGIQRGDTIVELNGKPVYSADDVRRMLKERQPDADVVVTLAGADARQARRTLRWSPSGPAPQAPAQSKPRKL